MFSTEIKFVGEFLIKWFNKKFKSKNLELSNGVKTKYEIENPIDWIEGRCLNLTQQILTQQLNKCLMLTLLFSKSTNF